LLLNLNLIFHENIFANDGNNLESSHSIGQPVTLLQWCILNPRVVQIRFFMDSVTAVQVFLQARWFIYAKL